MANITKFNLNLVPVIEMTTENIGGQRHYVLPNGKKYKSVTTIISERSDKTHLIEWQNK